MAFFKALSRPGARTPSWSARLRRHHPVQVHRVRHPRAAGTRSAGRTPRRHVCGASFSVATAPPRPGVRRTMSSPSCAPAGAASSPCTSWTRTSCTTGWSINWRPKVTRKIFLLCPRGRRTRVPGPPRRLSRTGPRGRRGRPAGRALGRAPARNAGRGGGKRRGRNRPAPAQLGVDFTVPHFVDG